jgi:hypothetical protein
MHRGLVAPKEVIPMSKLFALLVVLAATVITVTNLIWINWLAELLTR